MVLGEATPVTAEDTDGPGFVEDEAEFVAVFELDLWKAVSNQEFIGSVCG